MVENENMDIGSKYIITTKEAAQYFNLGIKKIRKLASENQGEFLLDSGNRYLIIRPKFEEFLNELAKTQGKV